MNLLSTATSVVALLFALSLAVERLVEMLKKMLRTFTAWLKSKNTLMRLDTSVNDSGVTEVYTFVLSAAIGTFLAWQSRDAIVAAIGMEWANKIGWETYFVVGILTSGGSKFWNQLLDLLHAAKVQKEAFAKMRLIRKEDMRSLSEAHMLESEYEYHAE
jgi:hypothetical protein